VPAATLGLLAVNIGLFCLVPRDAANRLCLLPLGALDLPHVLRTVVAGAWLHADAGLLAGNMVLLGCFGADLEGRIGRWRLVAAGLIGGLIAGLTHLNLLLQPIGIDTDPALMLPCGPLGASGAIAGLMGLFVAGGRGGPHLRLPRPCRSWRLNGILLIVLFLVRDLSGGGGGLPWREALVHGGSIAGAFAGGMMMAPAVGLRPRTERA
jgi:membrane associated rhomboid family serine protease